MYNLKAAKDIKRGTDAQKRNTDDTYAAEIITQVTDIENKKGHMITKTTARSVFNFLMEFARFATANL